jgi:hypothetical protein
MQSCPRAAQGSADIKAHISLLSIVRRFNFLCGRCVLEEHAAVGGFESPLSAGSNFKRTLAPRTQPGSADAEAHTVRYTARKWSYAQRY